MKKTAIRFPKIKTYLLFGGGGLLSESVRKLKEASHEVLVVTSPGYHREKLPDSSETLGKFLKYHKVEYQVVEKIEDIRVIKSRITSGTLGLCLGAPWVFRREFIDLFEGRFLNVHGARLPQGRGSGLFSWPLLRESSRLGCCLIHQLESGVDSGPIIKYREFLYPNWCRIPKDYQQVYLQENTKFLEEFFQDLEDEAEFHCIEQLEYLSTFWPKLSAEHQGYVDWNWRLKQLECFVCAFDDPYKGASTFINGKRVFIKNCFTDFSNGSFHPFQSGLIYRRSSGLLFVAAQEGTLVVGTVIDENEEDVMNTIKIGDRFYTPSDLLDKAKQFRAK